MTAAIFGLVGVIVGGFLNAGVTWWQARRSDVATTRVAARLIDLELRQAALILGVLGDQESPSHRDMKFETSAWERYREALARTLSDHEWQSVAAAYDVLEATPGRQLADAILAAEAVSGTATPPPRRSPAEVVTRAAFLVRRTGERQSTRQRLLRKYRGWRLRRALTPRT